MRYMLTVTWKQPPTEEALALGPVEKAKKEELREQGIQEIVYVAADGSIGWDIWNCESEAQVREILATLPMHQYFNVDIMPLKDEGE